MIISISKNLNTKQLNSKRGSDVYVRLFCHVKRATLLAYVTYKRVRKIKMKKNIPKDKISRKLTMSWSDERTHSQPPVWQRRSSTTMSIRRNKYVFVYLLATKQKMKTKTEIFSLRNVFLKWKETTSLN